MTHPIRLLACCAALALMVAGCSNTPATDAPAAAPATQGAWSLDPAASHLSYVSLKAGEIAELNRFETLSGTVAEDGTARITIDLASVNTGVEIRDTRMREIFFEVADFPSAIVTAQLDPARFAALDVGTVIAQPIQATLALKGMEAGIETELQITRVSENRVIASTIAPVIITTDMFELTDELGELRAIAELPSISPAVPVTFTFAFTR